MSVQIDYRNVHNDDIVWYNDNGDFREVRVEIEYAYGEYYYGYIRYLNGKELFRCPDGFKIYRLFKDEILHFNKPE